MKPTISKAPTTTATIKETGRAVFPCFRGLPADNERCSYITAQHALSAGCRMGRVSVDVVGRRWVRGWCRIDVGVA